MSDTEEGGVGIPLMEPLSPSTSPEPGPSGAGKRKREDETETTESKRAAKRKKAKEAKKSKKPRDITEEALDEEAGLNHAIAHMDSQLLADHIAQRTKRFHKDLSVMELEEMHIPSNAIVDTTSWDKPRDLENLPAFMERFKDSRRNNEKKGKKLSDAFKMNGTPHTIVIAGSGIRAADMTRALRKFQTKESMVAKLFAKHIKLDEAIKTVKETRMGMGVGTPQRIFDLLENGALSAGRLERIVIDASHIDQKKRGILDMKDTEGALIKLLSRVDFKEKYNEDEHKKIELLFY